MKYLYKQTGVVVESSIELGSSLFTPIIDVEPAVEEGKQQEKQVIEEVEPNAKRVSKASPAVKKTAKKTPAKRSTTKK